ncbi:MAG: hypothetical protein GXX78_16210 [Bacteroidales bacterium]|nr:hypothetical protein [Bacteroidales bacterium]
MVSFSDFVSSWQYIISNNFLPSDAKGILLDYRKATILSPIDEALKVSDYFSVNGNVFQHKKIAFVTETPEQIILPILIQEYSVECESRPFSTVEAAVRWITS